ncbi:3-methyl-2-oxobutanoate hydroxymethyltransferase [Actinocorallia sp. A-T 12471]|uniref:3-methyl-2-oxobutanoate hydroxymethyltransferase n=1 Tax=Actinocorallia sp. A-T 12471 TaxID=3089813 RepID=UPI0029CB79FB|nr:3-methyl-2-oxobutanoate hydroxymethyltransferase [Actinocorallia sp. A-T 12471]MDX6741767.1 3-methyl-2-oxobutanoate hydroxymethyltransferase [Actinocorallia sp. A-T 12471]
MSSHPVPPEQNSPARPEPVRRRGPVTLTDVAAMHRRGEPLVMVTAYDHPGAQVADSAGVDLVLAGDSAAMTVLGYPSTVEVSVEEMLMLTAAVRRGLTTALLVGDLPFGSYEVSDEQAVGTAQRFVKEAGCAAVKLEGGGAMAVSRARAIVQAGIPVMGHVGLTPQTAHALGGFKAQGLSAERAREILAEALALQDAGCFALVFEAIPTELTEAVMPRFTVPVIGIGAGAATDGQVLVFHDLLGIFHDFTPRFTKRYGDLRTDMTDAIRAFADEVRDRAFPGPEHCYHMPEDELAAFSRSLLPQSRRAATSSGA